MLKSPRSQYLSGLYSLWYKVISAQGSHNTWYTIISSMNVYHYRHSLGLGQTVFLQCCSKNHGLHLMPVMMSGTIETKVLSSYLDKPEWCGCLPSRQTGLTVSRVIRRVGSLSKDSSTNSQMCLKTQQYSPGPSLTISPCLPSAHCPFGICEHTWNW